MTPALRHGVGENKESKVSNIEGAGSVRATIEIPFPVGATVWRATVDQSCEFVTCRACAGTLRHSVTLGNGETETVFCDACGADRAFNYDYGTPSDRPPGTERKYSVRALVEKVTLADVSIRDGKVEYQGAERNGSRYIYDAESLFATEEEARAHSDAVCVPAAQKREDERWVGHYGPFRGKQTAEKAASDAAFWHRKRKDVAAELERIDRRLARLKQAKAAAGIVAEHTVTGEAGPDV